MWRSLSLREDQGLIIDLSTSIRSARHAKRLGQLSAPSHASDGSESDSDASLEEKRPAAGFAFLADDSDESESDASDSEEEEQQAAQPLAPAPAMCVHLCEDLSASQGLESGRD